MNTWIGADKLRTRWLLTACWPYTSSSLHASTRKSIILIKPLIYIFPAAFELALLEFWLALSNYLLVYGWSTITINLWYLTFLGLTLYKYTHLTHPYLIIRTAFKDYEWIQVADNGTLESRRHQTKLWSSGHIMRSVEKILIKKQKSNLK